MSTVSECFFCKGINCMNAEFVLWKVSSLQMILLQQVTRKISDSLNVDNCSRLHSTIMIFFNFYPIQWIFYKTSGYSPKLLDQFTIDFFRFKSKMLSAVFLHTDKARHLKQIWTSYQAKNIKIRYFQYEAKAICKFYIYYIQILL